MELINSNAGLIVLIGIVLNILFFVFSQKQNHKRFEESQRQSREQFEGSQLLTGYIAKKTIVKEPPIEWGGCPLSQTQKTNS